MDGGDEMGYYDLQERMKCEQVCINHSLRCVVAQRRRTMLSLIILSTCAFSAPSPIKRYRFFRFTSTSSLLTPQSCISTTSLLLTVLLLRIREASTRSMVSTTVRPSFSSPKQSSEEISSKVSFPIFCMHSALISNSFSNFSNRFQLSLLSTRARQISLVARTITQRMVRTASSMARCSSTSAPRRPCLRIMASKYLSPPKSMSSQTMEVSSQGSAAVKEAAIILSAAKENAFLARISCSMTSLPFMEWNTARDWAISGVGLLRRMARQSSKLDRYSCQSLLAGARERYGRMDSSSTSTPHSRWKRSCAGRECDSSMTSTSLLTNLLSSMTLCETWQLGNIRLARQSKILVSPTSGSTASSHNYNSASINFSTCSATSYSSTLPSSSNFSRVATRLSKRPFSTTHTHIRQQTSKILSSAGSSVMRSWKKEMHWMLMSELGCPRSLRRGRRRLESTRRGICSCVSSWMLVRMVSISSSAWQNFIGSVGYFILRVIFVSQSSLNCYLHLLNCSRVTSSSTAA